MSAVTDAWMETEYIMHMIYMSVVSFFALFWNRHYHLMCRYANNASIFFKLKYALLGMKGFSGVLLYVHILFIFYSILS